MSPLTEAKEETVDTSIPNQSTAIVVSDDLRVSMRLACALRIPVGFSPISG